MKHHYVIAYDVVSSKRRRKCAEVAYGYAFGGQKSAVEALLEECELPVVADELLDGIDPKEDRVNVVKVLPKAILFGVAKQLEYDGGAIII